VIPKSAFYENLKLKPKEKKLFVSQIDKITITNSIKPTTMSILAGEKHDEILVLKIDLKRREINGSILEAIARQNHHPLIFVCNYLNESCAFVFRQRLYDTGWKSAESYSLNTGAETIDDLWNGICSRIALGSDIGLTTEGLDTQLQRNRHVSLLEAEVEKLIERSRKEKQPAKKNRLFEEAQVKREEMVKLKEGLNGRYT